jgi:hypothetical protein
MATTEQVAEMLETMKKMMETIAKGAADATTAAAATTAAPPGARRVLGKDFVKELGEFDGNEDKYVSWAFKAK